MSGRAPGLILALDTQPTRLGCALVRRDGRPVWADTFKIRKMDPGPDCRDAMRRIDERIDGWARADDPDAIAGVYVLGVERGVVRGTSLDTLYDCGAAYGVARDAARRRFRDTIVTTVDDVRPSAVKLELLGQGKGNASKDELTVWVRRHALAHGWDEVMMNGLAMDDATDALAIGTFIARRRDEA